jgi:leucyl/phenylalanyl-tRNA---protein transferase
MPVFKLSSQLSFPPPHLAEDNGLLAVGGDLSPQRLLLAYRLGIFPWFAEGDPLLWWSPNPRLVLFPEEFTIPRRLQRYHRHTKIHTSRDCAFIRVIASCGGLRAASATGTWITAAMQSAYTELHHLGYAHSVECWLHGDLVGGLYGIALDRVFFGESMFSASKGASQFALIELLRFLKTKKFQMVDCQMTTNHLLRFGAREISGHRFHACLKEYINDIDRHEDWKTDCPQT